MISEENRNETTTEAVLVEAEQSAPPAEQPEQESKPYIPTKEEVEAAGSNVKEHKAKKKKSVAKRIFSVLLTIIVLLAAAAGVLYFAATYDDMPAAPEETTKIEDVITKTVTGLIGSEKSVELASGDMNAILHKVTPKFEETLSASDMALKESFVVMADNKATVYARIKYKGITLPVRVQMDIRFNTPHVVLDIENIKIGKLSLSHSLIAKALAVVELPENMKVENGFIYYDTTALNGILIDAIRSNEAAAKAESILDSLFSFFGSDFSYENTINISIGNVFIRDNKLVAQVDSLLN